MLVYLITVKSACFTVYKFIPSWTVVWPKKSKWSLLMVEHFIVAMLMHNSFLDQVEIRIGKAILSKSMCLHLVAAFHLDNKGCCLWSLGCLSEDSVIDLNDCSITEKASWEIGASKHFLNPRSWVQILLKVDIVLADSSIVQDLTLKSVTWWAKLIDSVKSLID